MDMNRQERLQKIIDDRFGGSQAEFARAISRSAAQIHQWVKGHRLLGDAGARHIEMTLNLPQGWMDIGSTLPIQEKQAPSFQSINVWESESDLEPGFVFVPRMTIRLAAGDGCEVIEESEKDKRQAFRAEWIRTLGLDAKKLVCMNAQGDSMIPEINDGDSLLVDRSQTQIIDGKIYAIRFGNSLKVKRLYKTLSGVLIQSANADKNKYRDEEITGSNLEHIEVLGRVVWKGGLM